MNRQQLVYPSNGYAIKPPTSSRIRPPNIGERLAIRPSPQLHRRPFAMERLPASRSTCSAHCPIRSRIEYASLTAAPIDSTRPN